MRTLVSLDIETTGLDPERDSIIEIGLVVFEGPRIVSEFSQIVDPGRPIPPKIVELTGITDDMVAREGASLSYALRETQKVCGLHPIVGHNIAFDLGFLRRQRVLTTNPAIDTFELASILIPHAGRYTLGALGKALGITEPATHRALDDARVAHQLYLKVAERAARLPLEALEEITTHAERSGWGLAGFWRDALEAGREPGAPHDVPSPEAQRARVFALRQRQEARPLVAREDTRPLDADAVTATLGPAGELAKRFPGYESRPQQLEMMRQVVKAFNEGSVEIVEAGTGTGKSLAYLIPAMLWAIQNGQRVVVSTNTINLQEQLMDKDVPAVIDALGVDARATVMKGKGRYVCDLRINDLRKSGPRTLEEARLLAKLLIWRPTTITGDTDELFIPQPQERMALSHLTAENPSCDRNSCSATDCFFHQARRLAESAHVVIVNHALLLADVAVENKALPEYKYLVVDEAHHLEAAATDALGFTIDRDELGRNLGEIARGGRKPTGLTADIAAAARAHLPPEQSGAVETQADRLTASAGRASQTAIQFFDELQDFLANQSGGENGDYAQRTRITSGLRSNPGWGRVERAFDPFLAEMNGVAKGLNTLFAGLSQLSERGVDGLELLLGRISGALRFTTEAIEQLNAIVSKPTDKQIYWAETDAARAGRGRGLRVTLRAAPLHVGDLIRQRLWDQKEGVVLTSATIRTASAAGKALPTFDYIKMRLDASDAGALALGSPFDFKSAALVYVASDIPEPNQQGYQAMLERGLIDFFRASQGRGMALFTSYAQLRSTSKIIAPALLRDGIQVFEQGEGLSRRAMLEQFRASGKAVILGTRSFWEGVDIQGEKLSALAICKLPFDVPTDPIFAARSETFDNPFSDYSVPESVLKFRQGFGRLIRSRSDRGVVAVFDRRVISKTYGQAFLNALPGPSVQRGPLAGLGRATAQWLAAPEKPKP
ncbi:MAG: DEAD/DEAH box helicase family protein [Thermoflexales bacterium]|nr:DEAD/DEAH box helicase family protein [Thermoflexales bacterium]